MYKRLIAQSQPQGNTAPLALEFHLKNIIRNGVKYGCSGFIKDANTGKIVYVNTEGTTLRNGQGDSYLYRLARHLKDYSGGSNRWAQADNLPSSIVSLLLNKPCF
ncbi:hypothetical protein [Moraxella caviae]|uniref:hypothetical protein n=1 Tax=Moraxella caviae TaxID=34060 RepID=UPI000E1B5358|nr:hypothetical protein [Moraxella caviae]